MSSAAFNVDDVPWWRVVRVDGSVGTGPGSEYATKRLIEEGVAFTNDGRVAKWAGSGRTGTRRPVKQAAADPEVAACTTDGCAQKWLAHAGPCD